MITDFIVRAPSKFQPVELATALKVLREFKSHESEEEWLRIPNSSWSKLEQLEEFLVHLVEGAPLAADTVQYMMREATEQ